MSKQYTESEKKQYVEDWKKSGLNIGKFAEMNNISLSAFGRWKKAYSNEDFGKLEFDYKSQYNMSNQLKTTFKTEKIEIYLKEGYSKSLLKSIMEVLMSDDC